MAVDIFSSCMSRHFSIQLDNRFLSKPSSPLWSFVANSKYLSAKTIYPTPTLIVPWNDKKCVHKVWRIIRENTVYILLVDHNFPDANPKFKVGDGNTPSVPLDLLLQYTWCNTSNEHSLDLAKIPRPIYRLSVWEQDSVANGRHHGWRI